MSDNEQARPGDELVQVEAQPYPELQTKVRKSNRVPIEELRGYLEYQRLTKKQKSFVDHYVGLGMMTGHYDGAEATRIAYECKTPEIARIMSYALLSNIRIIEVLNIHFNREPIEDFLRLLDRAIHNKKLTTAQMEALRLKADIMGFKKVPALPGRRRPIDVIPQEVLDAEKALKAKPPRKPRKTAPSADPSYGF